MVRLEKLMFTVRCVTLRIVLTHLLLVIGQMEPSGNKTSSKNQLITNPVPPMSELTSDSSTITEPNGTSTVTVPSTTTTEPSSTESTTTPTTTTLRDCSGKTVEALMALGAGTESLVLQWRDPDCEPFSIKSYEISLIPESNPSESVTLPVPATCVNTTDDYRRILLNSSTCGNPSLDAKLCSCTSYRLTVKVGYESLSGGSTNISAFTLPSAEEGHVQNLKFDEVNATSFKFSWDPPTCKYNIFAYNVTLKDLVQEVTVRETISGSQFVIAGDFGGIKIDPCTRYQVRMAPIFLNSTPGNAGEFITATTRSQSISFLNMNHTSSDRTVVLTWILKAPESCQGKISTFNLTYSIDKMNSSLTVNASCSPSGSCSYNITDLSLCSQYSVRIVPAEKPFDGLPSGNISGVYTHQGDEFRPTEVSFQPGSKWILVKFKPPPCAEKFQIDYYRFPITDLNTTRRHLVAYPKNITPSCFESREDFLLYNVSRGSDPCGQHFDIKPCTAYDRLRIKAIYTDFPNQLRAYDHFEQNVTTLPDLEEILQQPRVETRPDWFRVSWKHPSCKDYVSSWLVTVIDRSKEPPRQQIPFEIPITAEMRRKDVIYLNVSSGMLEYPGGSRITNLRVAPSRQYGITIAPKYNTTDETGKGISVSVETDKRVIGAFEVTSVGETEVSFTAEVDNQSQWLKLTDIITKKYAWNETTFSNCQSARIYRYACSHTVNRFLDSNYRWGERTYISPCRSYKLSIGSHEDATLAFYTPPGGLGKLTVLIEKATEDSVELKIGLNESCSLKLTAVHLSLFQNGKPTAIVDTKVDESCLKSARNQYQLTLGNRARCDSLKQITFQGCTKYYVTLLPELEGPHNGTLSNVSIVTEPRGSSANVRNITFPFYPTSLELLQWNAPECTVSLHLTKYYVSLYRVRNVSRSASASSAICSFQVGSHEFTNSGPIVQIKLMEQCKTELDSCSQYRVDIASSFEGLSDNYSESYSFTTPPSSVDLKVRGLAVTDVTQDSFKFSWENPLCGMPISFFRIEMNDGNNFIDVPSNYSVSLAAPLTISNEGISHKQFNNSQWKPPKLKACLKYTIYITPLYQIYGPGQSENLTFATKAAEIQPLKVTVTDVAATSAVIQWNEDLNPQCILRYEVSILNDSPSSSEGLKIGGTTKHTTFAVNGLIPNTSYSVTVYAHLTSGRRHGTELDLSFVTETEPTSSRAVWIPIVIVIVVAAVVVVLFSLLRRRRKPLERLVPVPASQIYETPTDVRDTAKGQLRKEQKPIRLSGLLKNRSKSLMPRMDQLEKEFQSLRLQKNFSTQDAASLPENKCRNRDAYILPFDFNRVLLSTDMASGNTDYINASYIPGLYGSRDYIASQAPTADTLADFWDMIWQQKVHVIVMLTAVKERGKVACEQYWPENNSACHGTVAVRLLKVELSKNFAVREMEITKGEDHRLIIQLHYTTWPELGCPKSTEDFIVFLRTVNEKSTIRGLGFFPVLVHGSAGVGRTGSFIATDILMKEAVLSEQIDVVKTVSKLRDHRPDMVQTLEQYAFIYNCIDLHVRTVLRTSLRPT